MTIDELIKYGKNRTVEFKEDLPKGVGYDGENVGKDSRT